MELHELQQRVKNFLQKKGWDNPSSENKYYTLIHFMEELGEFSRELLYTEDNRKPSKEREGGSLQEELADVFYHVLKLSVLYDLNLEEIFSKKMTKIEERFLSENDEDQTL